MATCDSFFTTADGRWFQPTEHTRGPWDPHACHAGPPTGLLARAVEQLFPEHRLTRLTVNLQRPVPFDGFGVAVRYPAEHNNSPGPTRAWLKTVPLLADETASAFQRICPLADCGNAFGRNAEPQDMTFMNTDLTLVLHRDPVGDWLGTESVGYWEPNGIGLADALLYDATGVVGRAMQTLILRKP